MTFSQTRVLNLTLLIFLSTASLVFGGSDFNEQAPQNTDRLWLFLEPEQLSGAELDRRLDDAAARLTQRSLERRRKVINREPPVRRCDIPVSRERIAALREAGFEVLREFPYLNAVTVREQADAAIVAARMDFIRALRHVRSYLADVHDENEVDIPVEFRIANEEDYGQSWRHSRMVNLPAVHELGYTGDGVLIGVQDNGFDNLNHACFNDLDLVATWDFVNDDENVSDHGDIGSGRHGTRTLSVIAGLDSGRYIGAAPGASYILTKTEISTSETRIEEDHWVAGLWYCDSLGVDVISSSVSYRNWYEYEDLDGETAVTTMAADSAAGAGIVIVNSVGNNGRSIYPDSKISAPADGNFVIGAGGVGIDSSYHASASQGPTFDGRIKPNVAALSRSVYVASNLFDTVYTSNSGTSYSAPVIAGIAALMLEANPDLTPQQVISILQATASKADDPDTLIGYGIVNALVAVEAAADSLWIQEQETLPRDMLFKAYPNPFNSLLHIDLRGLTNLGRFTVFDQSGRRILERDFGNILPGRSKLVFNFNGYPAGVYLIELGMDRNRYAQQVVLLK